VLLSIDDLIAISFPSFAARIASVASGLPFEYIQDGKPVGYDNEVIEKLRKFLPFEISTGRYEIAIVTRGTDGSNPASSSGESVKCQFL
jgi:hypothetical protein